MKNFPRISKSLLSICVLLAVVVLLLVVVFGNPLVVWHNHQLKTALQNLPEGTVTLEEAVPFQWDALYSFGPYTSRDEIERVIHSKSASIGESVSEEQRNFIFTKGDNVVCSVCDAPQVLGYDLQALPTYKVYRYSASDSQRDHSTVLYHGGSGQFAVSREDGIVKLRYIDQEISEVEKETMQIFQYKNLQLGITNVCDVHTETWNDELGDVWERPVYTCAPGAKIIVLHADMSDGADTENGQPYGQWKIYQSASDGSWEERIELVDGMAPFPITEQTTGIGAEDAYVLCFELTQE